MSIEKNSMLFWYPKIKDLNIPQPKTEIIEITDFWQCIDDYKKLEPFVPRLRKAAKEIGFPLFMRTDLASGKHDWDRVAFMEDEDMAINRICALLDDTLCKDLLSSALVYREYIEMDSAFKAFQGLPISRERRYFVNNGKVICHHSYWIESAIWFRKNEEPKNWKMLLKEVNHETEEEIELLTKYAELVGSKFEGYWSVDFCKAKDGRWILIDMASGYDSWHPDCLKKKEREN